MGEHRGTPVNRFTVGDQVTILAPCDDDPYITRMQTHVYVSQADSGVCFVHLPGDNQKYGPYAESRLTPGWGMPDAWRR